MIDFTLNEAGDIVLAPARQYPSFTIDLYIPDGDRKHETFRIDFDTDIKQYYPARDKFLITFDTDLYYDPTAYFTTSPLIDNEELAQEVTIRLKTEAGEFTYLPGLGSKIVLERHEDIRSETILEQIKEQVEEAIADVDFPDEYTVTVERVDDESRFRYETLCITIDTGKTQRYESTI